MKPSKNPDVLESASAIKRRLQRVVGTPRYDELRDSLMLLVGRTTVTYHVEQWMSHAKELEVELNGALDKLEKLGSANDGTHRREAAAGDVEMQTSAATAASRSVQ